MSQIEFRTFSVTDYSIYHESPVIILHDSSLKRIKVTYGHPSSCQLSCKGIILKELQEPWGLLGQQRVAMDKLHTKHEPALLSCKAGTSWFLNTWRILGNISLAATNFRELRKPPFCVLRPLISTVPILWQDSKIQGIPAKFLCTYSRKIARARSSIDGS